MVDYKSMQLKDNPSYGYPQHTNCKLSIFSDGSLIKKPAESAASGLYIWQGFDRKGYRLGENVTVWQSELYGVKKAAQYLIKNQGEIKDEICVIYLDSQAAIKALGTYKTRSKLVIRTIHLLNAAAKLCKQLIISWVKGHQEGKPEFIGNLNSDFIANSTAKNLEIPIEYDAPKPSFSTIKSKLVLKVDDLWGQKWMKKEDYGRQTKLFFPYIDKSRSHKILCRPKRVFSRLCQFISGHNFLARHNFIVYGPQDEGYDPNCQYCDMGMPQTAKHLLSDCGYFLLLRSQIFRAYTIDPPFTFPISKLVTFLISMGIEDLLWEDGAKI